MEENISKNPSNSSNQSVEILTLVLGETRIPVDKEILATESHYFESLFSHNFNDSHNTEHVINYDIEISTLQNFVNWLNDESDFDETYNVRSSLLKFINGSFMELINLLQLSVLFMTDVLTDDITDIIIIRWLTSDMLIDIWLLAKELGLNILKNIVFSEILDRFESIPVSSLIDLSRENILKILNNMNLNCTKDHMAEVIETWNKCNKDSEKLSIKGSKFCKLVQCLVVNKYNGRCCKESYIYCWDNKKFSELEYLGDFHLYEKDLVGMQVTGRRFSIYTVGGEYGLGTGQFNLIIQRYCLISKKWYYLTKLPSPRRHMIAVCIDNKLILVGGIGRHRVKLSSVDVLNLHTGEWTQGANVPEEFTEVPVHGVMKGRLYVLKTYIYVYDPIQTTWTTIITDNICAVQRTDAFIILGTSLFCTREENNQVILSRIHVTNYPNQCLEFSNSLVELKDFAVIYDDNHCRMKFGHVFSLGIMLLGLHCETCFYSCLHIENERRPDLSENSINPKLGSFTMIDPETLDKETVFCPMSVQSFRGIQEL